MIGIIAAVSSNGVIGIDGHLPFNYLEDLNHFKKTTLNTVVIMGRKTFESIKKPLPERVNIVVSSSVNYQKNNIKMASSLMDAISIASSYNKDIWLIGGNHIYTEGLRIADKIVLTVTPDIVKNHNSIKFPWINPLYYSKDSVEILNLEKQLYIITYNKIL